MNPRAGRAPSPFLDPVPAFRLVALLEAASWAGLLIGMTFKYLVVGGSDLGHHLVAVFGTIHGVLVIVYLALAACVAVQRRWTLATASLAVAATVPPFATVAFDAWAGRTGRYRRR